MSFHLSFKDGINPLRLKLFQQPTIGLFPTEEIAYYWKKSQYPSHMAPVSRQGNKAGGGISNPKADVLRLGARTPWRMETFITCMIPALHSNAKSAR